MSGITEFYQTAQSYGFARKNLFRVNLIQLDNTTPLYVPDTKGNLYLYVRDGNIPQRVVKTTNITFKSFNYNIPTNIEYPEADGSWQVTLFSDEEYVLRSLLEKWSVSTYDEHTATSSAKWWESNMEIVLLNNNIKGGAPADGKLPSPTSLEQTGYTKKYKLMGIFPSNIGSLAYDVTDAGNLVTMTVNIGFQYIISEDKA